MTCQNTGHSRIITVHEAQFVTFPHQAHSCTLPSQLQMEIPAVTVPAIVHVN
jgi:hypothetical protein